MSHKTSHKTSHTRKNKHYLNMPHSENNNALINVANRILATSNPLLGPVVKGVKKTVKKIRGRMGGKNKLKKSNKKHHN